MGEAGPTLRFMDVVVEVVEVAVRERRAEVSLLRRRGPGPSLVLLHGLGASKHDFVPALRAPGMESFDIVAIDFPGCGSTAYPPDGLTIEDLADLVGAVADRLGLTDATVVGHSLGGVVGLLVAERRTDLVARFVDIEGNLAPEDCFLSRQLTILEPGSSGSVAQAAIVRRQLGGDPTTGARLFADRLAREIEARAVRDYATSLVRLSDDGHLLERLFRLACPAAFVHGERRRAQLPYLDALDAGEIELVQVPKGGHWPHVDDPAFLYSWLSGWVSPRPVDRHDVHRIAAAATGDWYNVPVCRVNDHAVRLSVMTRDFHWHRHAETDELFYVVDGRLHLDLEDEGLTLGPGELAVVPRGTLHRTRPEGRSVNLTFEVEGTDPRGDAD